MPHDNKIILELTEIDMLEVVRSFNMLKATPKKYRKFFYDDSPLSFNKWVSFYWALGRNKKGRRVKMTRYLLTSGLSPKKIENIIKRGDGGTRCEENTLLEEAKKLINQGGYTIDQIAKRLWSKEFLVVNEDETLRRDIMDAKV